MQKITPFLWFDKEAEEAMSYYTSLFPDSRVTNVSRYPKGSPGPEGGLMTASFTLNGQEFMVLNGGPQFQFTEAISLLIHCDSQEEVDFFWEKLSDGGETSRCGWLKDRWGLSWQVVPTVLGRLMADPAKSGRVVQAMLQMDKLDIARLQSAADEA